MPWHVIIASFVVVCAIDVLVLAALVLRGERAESIVLDEPVSVAFMPEVRVARARAMAVPSKHARYRTRSSK